MIDWRTTSLLRGPTARDPLITKCQAVVNMFIQETRRMRRWLIIIFARARVGGEATTTFMLLSIICVAFFCASLNWGAKFSQVSKTNKPITHESHLKKPSRPWCPSDAGQVQVNKYNVINRISELHHTIYYPRPHIAWSGGLSHVVPTKMCIIKYFINRSIRSPNVCVIAVDARSL